MSIKIIKDGADIVLTQSEYLRLMREYERCISFMVDPPTFEEWVRGRANHTEYTINDVLRGIEP
jgi:uncharacterized protein YciU (UPF0263 family)